ncbi:DUF3313 domain-containing protein [Xanthobacter variabilis]|uniref:DUF3313 domain-containing protein n=1 Tax=Xanthobacter variabilis TaxID=3119932 RepID=UPI0037289AB8
MIARTGLILCTALAGCANSPEPAKYQRLSSAAQLSPTGHGASRRVPYAYEAQNANLSAYRAVWLEPIAVYAGADHQFGTLTASERGQLATAAEAAFRAALATRGLLAPQPLAPRGNDNVADLKITLTGAQASIPVLATATRLTPAGLAASGLAAATGSEGRFSGVVMYAVELRDSRTGGLLWAYVTKQYPNALDIGATLGPLDAARQGLKTGAEELAAALAMRMGQP